jgi:HEAT repeat protein/pectate lyase
MAQDTLVPRHLKALGSSDEAVRDAAIEALVLSGPKTVAALTGSLQHEEELVREGAASVLGMLGPDSASAVGPLARRLEADESSAVRHKAAVALASIGAPAIDRLTLGIDHQDPLIRKECVSALRVMGAMAKPALPKLIESLEDSDSTVRREATKALGRMGQEAVSAIPALARRVGECGDRTEQWLAAGSLARMGPASIAALTRLLDSKQPGARAAASLALAATGERGESLLAEQLTTGDIAGLVEAFDHHDKQFPWWAARSLEIIGPQAVPALAKTLGRDDDNIQLAVIYALLRLERAALPALPAITAVLRDGNRDVRHRALYGVQRMGRGATAAIPSLIEILRSDNDFRMHHSTIRVLAVFGSQAADAIPDLLESFKLKHPTVTKMASRTLSRIGPAALPAVIRGLGSKHEEVRRGCAMTLAQMNEKAVPVLLNVLAGDNDVARMSAVDAIQRVGPNAKGAEPTLEAMLRDEQTNSRLRVAVKSALARITGESEEPTKSPSRRPVSPKSQTSLSSAALPAFPGAEGFGATTVGGRGGRVMMVTNLNDSGPGSLRYACEAKGPRIVVFRVSGIIELKQRLTIREPYLTIAGQTAPGGGICLKNYGLRIIDTHDIVVRHLRMRSGDLTHENQDSLDVFRARNVVINHCSISWGTDEVLDTIGDVEVTFSWCMITEGLPDGWHSKQTHGKGSLLSAESGGISLHHCIHAHHKRRSPRVGGQQEDSPGVVLDCRNNVIYNWGDKSGQSTTGPVRINYVGNYLKPGPSTQPEARMIAFTPGGRFTRLFMDNNHIEDASRNRQQDWRMVDLSEGGSEQEVRADNPFAAPRVATSAPDVAYEMVLNNAGAVLPARDAVDIRIVQEVRLGKGAIIDSQTWVGGWSYYWQQPAPRDSDWDGMPDDWERRHSLNPHDSTDNTFDADQDGYTNIEEYLNKTSPRRGR